MIKMEQGKAINTRNMIIDMHFDRAGFRKETKLADMDFHCLEGNADGILWINVESTHNCGK